jgi:hypothetical protein
MNEHNEQRAGQQEQVEFHVVDWNHDLNAIPRDQDITILAADGSTRTARCAFYARPRRYRGKTVIDCGMHPAIAWKPLLAAAPVGGNLASRFVPLVPRSRGPTPRFCSFVCRRGAYMEQNAKPRLMRECQHCGTEFVPPPHGPSKYCSEQCRREVILDRRRAEAAAKPPTLPEPRDCGHCTTSFIPSSHSPNARYCCELCQRKAYAAAHAKPKVERVERKPRVCSVEDCGAPAIARGFCSKHWQRLRRGAPLTSVFD